MPNHLIKVFIALCMVLVIMVPAPSVWAESIVKDPNLAKAIRAELKKSPTGEELKLEDLQKLSSLFPMNTDDRITNLEGLEQAVNMDSLFLPGQGVMDITPIGKLKQLSFLAINGNQVKDLSPLTGLSSLQKLVLDQNQIKNLDPLAKVPQLTDLLASGNQISDLSPLRGLKLKWIIMTDNQIQDLEPLRNHPTLENLYLDNNQIQDIAVLETIPNLKSVSLKNNPLNKEAGQILDKLAQSGVTIQDRIKEVPQKPLDIEVVLNGMVVEFEHPPFMKEGSTLVPFRTLFEKLGLKITWIESTKTIIGEKEGITIRLQIDQPIAEVNGKQIQLAVAPTLVSDTNFVPLRFVAESVEAKVEWNNFYRRAIIQSKEPHTSPDGTIRVTAYGKWTPYTFPSKSVKLAMKQFKLNTFEVSAVSKEELPQGTGLNQFYKDRKTEIIANSEAYFIEEKDEVFQGHPAKQLVYNLLTEEGWINFVCTSLFFELDGSFYQITAGANVMNQDAQEELNGVMNSFELIKK